MITVIDKLPFGHFLPGVAIFPGQKVAQSDDHAGQVPKFDNPTKARYSLSYSVI